MILGLHPAAWLLIGGAILPPLVLVLAFYRVHRER